MVVCRGQDVEGLSPTATSIDPERYPHGHPQFTIRTRLWSKLAPLRGMCVSMLSLVGPTSPPRAKSNEEDDIPPTYIGSITLILTSSPLYPSPFDQTVLLTHSHPTLHPLNVSTNLHTIIFPSETEMLAGFRDFLIKYDPDLVTGYDVCEEISEILDRAKDLGLPKTFPHLARPSSIALKPRYPTPFPRL